MAAYLNSEFEVFYHIFALRKYLQLCNWFLTIVALHKASPTFFTFLYRFFHSVQDLLTNNFCSNKKQTSPVVGPS